MPQWDWRQAPVVSALPPTVQRSSPHTAPVSFSPASEQPQARPLRSVHAGWLQAVDYEACMQSRPSPAETQPQRT